MSRPNPGKLAAFLAVLILIASLPVFLKGGLYITNYEGDALHLADIALRMEAGERPHLDFMTPLGALAFWPVVLGLGTGADLGRAFAIGQTGFAAAAAVLVWWAASTRLSPRLAYGFAAACVALLTSLSHGAAGSMIAISMHYNRWAWVLAFVAVVMAALRPRARSMPLADGAVLGLSLAGLGFLKATYLAAFGPAVLLILIARRDLRVLGATCLWGALVLLAIVVSGAAGGLWAYIHDLRTVAGGEVRAKPGLGFTDIVVSPAYLVGTLTALAGLVFLRRGGARTGGLVILILIPAFLYVTWQNFGNDPIWLILLSVLLFAMRPARRAATPPEEDPSVGVGLAGFSALVLSVPLLQNHAMGGIRLLTLDTAQYVTLVPGGDRLGDVFMPALPAHLARGRVDFTDPGEPLEGFASKVPDHAPMVFRGESLPNCQVVTGIPAFLEALSGDLAMEERAVFVVDLISSHWLFGGAEPLPGGAPWNYGTLSGFDAATHVLVPLCPIDLRARKAILARLEGAGVSMTLVRRTPLYLLYQTAG